MKYIKCGLAVLMSISAVLLASCGSPEPASQENADIIVAAGSTVRTDSETAPTDTESESAEQTSATTTEITTTSETTSAKPTETTIQTTTVQTTETTTTVTAAETTAASTSEITESAVTENKNTLVYVLNTNTKRIHYSDCSSVKTIHPENYSETTDYDGAIKAGFKPCGRCKP